MCKFSERNCLFGIIAIFAQKEMCSQMYTMKDLLITKNKTNIWQKKKLQRVKRTLRM